MAEFSLDELLEAVDGMRIYKKDYDIIVDLMKNTPPEFFTKVLEEVLNGNLIWSDFERVISYTGYSEFLKRQFQIDDYLSKVQYLRNTVLDSIASSETLSKEQKARLISLSFNNDFLRIDNSTKSGEELIKEQESIYRSNVLEKITESNPNDSPIVKAAKIKLYNAILNGNILKTKISNGENVVYDDISITKDGKPIRYINADDIILFLKEYLIPLEYSTQQLTESDLIFMEENGLGTDEMKKIKALKLFLEFKYNSQNEEAASQESGSEGDQAASEEDGDD